MYNILNNVPEWQFTVNGESDGKPLDLRCSFTENPSFVSGSQWGKPICQRDGRHEIGRAGDARRGGEWWPRRLPGAVRCWRWGLHQRCSLGEVSQMLRSSRVSHRFQRFITEMTGVLCCTHYMCISACRHAHTHIFICIYIYVCIHIYIYMCVCMYVYIHIYIFKTR